MIFNQAEFDIRCEWGEKGVTELAPISDVVIIVDVLSFSSAVSIATVRGAIVYPFRGKGNEAAVFARSVGAELAGMRGGAGYTLSPVSLLTIPPGTRLVLPSPNGSTLTLAAGEQPTLAGCLRNARAVARTAVTLGKRIAVIPCGERWKEDGVLRPAIEDLIGAGAIIRHLPGSLSPEAQTALAAFERFAEDLYGTLSRCASGKELVARGHAEDVRQIARLDVTDTAPLLKDGAYVQVA